VALYEVTASPTYAVARDALAGLYDPIRPMSFSRGGLPPVATETEVEVWNPPDLGLVSRARQEGRERFVVSHG
jgi:hypothetical protein